MNDEQLGGHIYDLLLLESRSVTEQFICAHLKKHRVRRKQIRHCLSLLRVRGLACVCLEAGVARWSLDPNSPGSKVKDTLGGQIYELLLLEDRSVPEQEIYARLKNHRVTDDQTRSCLSLLRDQGLACVCQERGVARWSLVDLDDHSSPERKEGDDRVNGTRRKQQSPKDLCVPKVKRSTQERPDKMSLKEMSLQDSRSSEVRRERSHEDRSTEATGLRDVQRWIEKDRSAEDNRSSEERRSSDVESPEVLRSTEVRQSPDDRSSEVIRSTEVRRPSDVCSPEVRRSSEVVRSQEVRRSSDVGSPEDGSCGHSPAHATTEKRADRPSSAHAYMTRSRGHGTSTEFLETDLSPRPHNTSAAAKGDNTPSTVCRVGSMVVTVPPDTGVAKYDNLAPDVRFNLGDIMTGATCGAGDAHSSGTPDLAFAFCEEKLQKIIQVFDSNAGGHLKPHEIAQLSGIAGSAKGVNKYLYHLEKKGILQKSSSGSPLWGLAGTGRDGQPIVSDESLRESALELYTKDNAGATCSPKGKCKTCGSGPCLHIENHYHNHYHNNLLQVGKTNRVYTSHTDGNPTVENG